MRIIKMIGNTIEIIFVSLFCTKARLDEITMN